VLVALVFTVFALVIAYFGAAQQGAVGFRSIDVTIASLVSLVIYLIPLIALILGFDAIVGERERGSLDLLLTLPITRKELILGKYAGLAAALAFSTIAGFGAVGADPVAPAQPHRPLPLRRLHVLGHPAGLRLPEPGRDAVGVRRRPHPRLRPRHRHLVLLRAGLRPAASARWSSPPATTAARSSPTCCCSTRPTSSACSTCSAWTKCAPSTASPPSSPKP
jgi:hypothetical protein